jgi:hypothetical protein
VCSYLTTWETIMSSRTGAHLDLLWDGLLVLVMLSSVFAQGGLLPMWLVLGAAPLLACRLRIHALAGQLR